MVRVIEVTRKNKIATRVVISMGEVEIAYILGEDSKLIEDRKYCDKQILDDQGLIISPVDLQKSKDIAGAILHAKIKKTQQG